MSNTPSYAGEYEIVGTGRRRVGKCLSCGYWTGSSMTENSTPQERAISQRRFANLVAHMEAHCDRHNPSRFTPNTPPKVVHGDDPPF